MAQATHFCGDHATAKRLAERVLDYPPISMPLAYNPVAVDRRVSMRIVLARILWLEGRVDQAVGLSDECLEYASADSPHALCQALALAACPIAFWRGDRVGAGQLALRLAEEAIRHRLGSWREYGELYQHLARLDGDRVETVVEAVATSRALHPIGLIRDTVLTIDPEAVAIGHLETASASSWCAPELLRIQAERLLKTSGVHQASEAEAVLLKSLELAETQNAVSWRLRSAMSLATLWRAQNRSTEARELLSSVYSQFTEGYGTQDLRKAQVMTKNLG